MTDSRTTPESIRIDIWLWAARFYKTRGIAATAVTAGHVTINGLRCKRAKTVRPGDTIAINRSAVLTEVVLLQLSDRRGPATQAQALYQETETSRSRAELLRSQRAPGTGAAPAPSARPTKRNRRALDSWTRGEY